MPKLISPLTDIQLRNAKPAEKPYKLSDGGAMYVEVMPNGSKFWRMKGRQANGKESRHINGGFGAYLLTNCRAQVWDMWGTSGRGSWCESSRE
jgi:hypothetical protein